MIDRLRELVRTRSLSREESAAADLVSGWLAAAGLNVARCGNNIWCAAGDAPRPRLLLNSHLDTVPPGAGWTVNPWAGELHAGRLTALGANDAKGCVVALLSAFLELHARVAAGATLGGTVVLALTAEEETSGAGLGTILDQLAPIDAALVGEPTSLRPLIAQRGMLILRGVTAGRSVHPANTTPAAAENAILRAAAALRRLETFDWGPADPLLGQAHGHVTTINGGLAHNVIPDACAFFVDIRTTPAEAHAALLQRLREHLGCELHVHSDRLVPVATAADEPIVQACVAAAEQPPAGSPAMSDMVFLAGIPAVKIGPGDTRRSHTPNEYVLLDEVTAGAETYQRAIQQYFARAAARAATGARR